MSSLYDVLSKLCESKDITAYKMCKDVGMQPSVMTDLKMGRRSSVKAETADRLANYFGVSVGYLLGKENKPATNEGDGFSKETLIFAEKVSRLSPEKIKLLRDYMEYLESKGDQ